MKKISQENFVLSFLFLFFILLIDPTNTNQSN
jgi:glycerol uptake facilitator-like aquaporin